MVVLYKQLRMAITIRGAMGYQGGGIITIGEIHQQAKLFVKPIQRTVSAHVYSCLLPARSLVAICTSRKAARMHPVIRHQEVQNVIKVPHEKQLSAAWKSSLRHEIGQFESLIMVIGGKRFAAGKC